MFTRRGRKGIGIVNTNRAFIFLDLQAPRAARFAVSAPLENAGGMGFGQGNVLSVTNQRYAVSMRIKGAQTPPRPKAVQPQHLERVIFAGFKERAQRLLDHGSYRIQT